MSLSLFRFSTCLPLLTLLTSCAAGVTYVPADIVPIVAPDQRPIVIMEKQIDIKLDTGYTRSLIAGSQWMRVGAIAQGQVYRPYNTIFTLEGTHVHEAYLVIANNYLTGFYLPVERGYSPLKQKISLPFTSTTK